ncbi:MAG: hypothetical protein PSY14_08195 [bacterium]|nr:hypothetical protein [bacterium]
MKFWASVECDQASYPAIRKTRQHIEPFLNSALEKSNLVNLEATLLYVPIVMPDERRERYPARSKLRKKEKAYDCSPQLNYEVFINGTFEDQLREYLHGIASSAPHLAGLGASKKQIAEFQEIIDSAADQILAAHTKQSQFPPTIN